MNEATGSLTRAEGYATYRPHDGQAALKLAVALQPDLIVLDHQMPRMTGCALGHALRREPLTVHIKIVMHSPTDESTIRESFRSYDRFQPKSADPAPLLRAVNELLAESRIATAHR
jgi:CheY-like chemotaxis protein